MADDRATENLLASLHGLVAQSLTAEIQRLVAEGEGITPSLIAQAIKFLKDNGIDAPARENTHIDSLANELGDLDLDEFHVN